MLRHVGIGADRQYLSARDGYGLRGRASAIDRNNVGVAQHNFGGRRR
jgi:hypothetical protein